MLDKRNLKLVLPEKVACVGEYGCDDANCADKLAMQRIVCDSEYDSAQALERRPWRCSLCRFERQEYISLLYF